LKVTPTQVITDAAPIHPGVLEELLPSAWRHVEQYENNPIADHGQLKRRLRPTRGLIRRGSRSGRCSPPYGRRRRRSSST
jgi:hypothetical protein